VNQGDAAGAVGGAVRTPDDGTGTGAGGAVRTPDDGTDGLGYELLLSQLGKGKMLQ
jgi:hypothetical protein